MGDGPPPAGPALRPRPCPAAGSPPPKPGDGSRPGLPVLPRAHTRFQRVYLGLSTRWNAHAAAHLLADSEATRADLARIYGTPPAKVTVAYPGCDESLAPVRDPAALAAVRDRYGIRGSISCTWGRLQPRKNLSRLVLAFSRLPTRSVLVLAGPKGGSPMTSSG